MIRPFTESDTDAVVELWLDSARTSHGFLPPSFWEDVEENIRTMYLPMSDEVVLHFDDASCRLDAFIAFAGYFLGALFVAPGAQGRGLGARMFRIARRMHPCLTLTVYKDNARAVAFYEKQGLAVLEDRVEAETDCVEYIMGFRQDNARN